MNIGSASGISFAGLGSGIDTESIVGQLMQLENIPVRRMQAQQLKLQSKLNLYSDLNSKIAGFSAAVAALGSANVFSPVKSASSDTSVATVTLGSNAGVGSFDLHVKSLARAHKVTSSAQTSSDTALNQTGEFFINGKSVKVAATDSLSAIAGKINSSRAGVTATVIGGSGSSYLSLTANSTGADFKMAMADGTGTVLNNLGFTGALVGFRERGDNGALSTGFSSTTDTIGSMTGSSLSGTFKINGKSISANFGTDNLQTIASKINAAGAGVTASVIEVTQGATKVQKLAIKGFFATTPIDTDGVLKGLGVLQANYSNEVVAAKDAEFTIDGIGKTNFSNNVTDAIAGVNLTLLKDESSGTANTRITLDQDTDKVKGQFKSYVEAFNGFMDYVKANSSFDTKTFASGPLFGDTVTNQAVSTLQNVLFERKSNTGTYQSLADLGFGLDSDGKVTLDESKLATAIANDSESVKKLMVSFGSSTSSELSFVSSTNSTRDPGSSGFKINVTQLATKSLTKSSVAQTTGSAGGETLSFSGTAFGKTIDVFVSAGTTASQLVTQINSDTRLKDNVVASLDVDGKLKIEAKRYGSATDFRVKSNLAAGSDNSGIGDGDVYSKGLDIEGTINGEAAVGSGQYLVGKDGNKTSAGFQILYTGTATGDVGSVGFSQGLSAKMASAVESLTDASNGLVTASNKAIQAQVDDLTTRIESYQDRLTLREQNLRAKFLAMEQAISQLQAQQARLSAMNLGTR